VIFLVNRLGEVNTIALPFLEQLEDAQLHTLLRACAWCTTWYGAANLSRRRRLAIEAMRRR
jgi:hypothetical protein